MEDNSNTFRPCDTQELIQQIGLRTILAISSGRVGKRETGITLPVAAGYAVTVDLAANDTYTVRRTFRGRVTGEIADVYCDEVGDTAYYASCYVSHREWGKEAQDVAA